MPTNEPQIIGKFTSKKFINRNRKCGLISQKPMVNTTKFIRDLWGLLRPYWCSEESRSAWLLLVDDSALTLGTVYMTVLFNQWYNLFYNSLADNSARALL